METKLKFNLGQLRATPLAINLLQESGDAAISFIARHAGGDWGVVSAEDKDTNDRALLDGERLVSAYILRSGEKIWVITEADRSGTTILLPDEY